jgi:hypothetical protein
LWAVENDGQAIGNQHPKWNSWKIGNQSVGADAIETAHESIGIDNADCIAMDLAHSIQSRMLQAQGTQDPAPIGERLMAAGPVDTHVERSPAAPGMTRSKGDTQLRLTY